MKSSSWQRAGMIVPRQVLLYGIGHNEGNTNQTKRGEGERKNMKDKLYHEKDWEIAAPCL